MNEEDAKSNPDGKPSIYIEMDLQKLSSNSSHDQDEQILHNSKIDNEEESMDGFFDGLVVMQKWSWSHQVSGTTFTASKKRGFDVLSNPIKTKATTSTKNTLLFIKKQQGFGQIAPRSWRQSHACDID